MIRCQLLRDPAAAHLPHMSFAILTTVIIVPSTHQLSLPCHSPPSLVQNHAYTNQLLTYFKQLFVWWKPILSNCFFFFQENFKQLLKPLKYKYQKSWALNLKCKVVFKLFLILISWSKVQLVLDINFRTKIVNFFFVNFLLLIYMTCF